ncbi:MAG: D-glycero-beta-D-manno-heptose 1,7-bisphosphate 7-phosphatase [Burkholderiales bacterium]
MPLRPAVFLDRDGTVNVEKHYLHRFDDWEWIPGAVDAIRRANHLGFVVIVVTNQAGVARGLYGEADVIALHQRVDEVLRAAGAHVDAYYHCPHHPEHGARIACDCRKPHPGMLLRAAREHGLDLPRSFLVGDRESDIEAARRAGVTPLLVATGYGERTRGDFPDGTAFVPSIVEAIDFVARSVAGPDDHRGS